MVDRLIDLDSCFECPEDSCPSLYNRTEDHVVPLLTKKLYKPLVSPFIKKPHNRIVVCREHHVVIDYLKIAAVRDFGLLGLVCFLASEYPDGRQELRDTKRLQFKQLFEDIRKSVKTTAREKVQPEVIRDYPLILRVLDISIDTFTSGLLRVPSLELPTRENIIQLRAA